MVAHPRLILLATLVAHSFFDDLSKWGRKVLRIKMLSAEETGEADLAAAEIEAGE